jgi:hypothetical protein
MTKDRKKRNEDEDDLPPPPRRMRYQDDEMEMDNMEPLMRKKNKAPLPPPPPRRNGSNLSRHQRTSRPSSQCSLPTYNSLQRREQLHHEHRMYPDINPNIQQQLHQQMLEIMNNPITTTENRNKLLDMMHRSKPDHRPPTAPQNPIYIQPNQPQRRGDQDTLSIRSQRSQRDEHNIEEENIQFNADINREEIRNVGFGELPPLPLMPPNKPMALQK